MRVNVIGTRGFPYIQGGVEKHCESLYPLIAIKGCKVKVFRKTPYIHNRNALKVFRKVQFCDLWTPKNKNLETIIHSLLASIICLWERPDIVHIHNIGPSLILPLLKVGRLTTVVTYHSPNYKHAKWSCFAKQSLKIGEEFVRRWADQVIFVSRTQAILVDCKNKVYIPNGVNIPDHTSRTDQLIQLGIMPGEYILAVARFSPEKGLHDLIEAFKGLDCNHKLVIAGDADCETDYSRQLRQLANDDDRVILTGYIAGDCLCQVYTHARLFVLPSYHEGFPMSLLEAISYGLSILVSDIPGNKEVRLPPECYFQCGDVEGLKAKIRVLLRKELSHEEQQEMRNQIKEKYNWDKIADQTIEVYRKALGH